jgi:alpha-L-rhamnosidase
MGSQAWRDARGASAKSFDRKYGLSSWRWLSGLVLVASLTAGQQSAAQPASAPWVTHPAAIKADAGKSPIALQFRREFDLKAAPRRFSVRVSADNRFVLYVNGQRAGEGPARGDLAHWRFQQMDLAPYLRAGNNVIAAQVWNDATLAPLAQVSARTGFLLTPEDPSQNWVATGPQWRVRVDRSRSVAPGMAQVRTSVGGGFYAAGPPETLVGSERDWTWAAAKSSATDWEPSVPAVSAQAAAPWTLTADKLPAMAYQAKSGGALVRAQGVAGGAFPSGPVIVPAHSTATLVLDAGAVEAAYPELTISGGEGAEVSLTYAEALYGPDKKRLTNRAQVEGGSVLGLRDVIRPDGAAQRTYQPYWWRVWRFVEVRVKTGDQPLTLERFARHWTGYPFKTPGRFASNDPQLDRIWRVGWDTVRVDAHETYMDSSYWEQLQYIGDTRLQMLVTYALTGDPRLPVQALDAVSDSQLKGLPRSAYPSRSEQSIPPFTLIWVGMLHDYWMRQPDTAPLKRNLPGVRNVLDWYARATPDGLVTHTPGWQFIDWRPGLSEMPKAGEPARPDSCVITLLYVGALKQAADLETAVGDPAKAQADRAAAERSAEAVRARCWSPERQLFADTVEKKAFSQHTNVLAVLYDVAPRADQVALLDRVTVRGQGIDAPQGVTGVSYYFSFYLARALEHAGLGDRYLELLKPWRAMLAQNFTTWPENEDPSRSDTHAWSAHPTADLLAVVAGVEPDSPGFATVRIAPHLGDLTRLDATVAHPQGLVEVSYRRSGAHLRSTIILPAKLHGRFDWGGRSVTLRPGRNVVDLEAAAPSAP